MTLSDLIPGVSEAKVIAMAVAGGAIVLAIAGLAIALTITRHTLADRTTQLATSKAALAAESNAHQVTIQSLGQCNTQLAAKSAESDARAKAYSTAQAQQQADDAKNDKLQQTVTAQHDALLAMAKVPGGSCKVPDALVGNLGGL